MTPETLLARFTELAREIIPFPAGGQTTQRHSRIFAAGREDLSLAKLIEAHWDAQSILHEAALPISAHSRYAVWASEVPGKALQFDGQTLTGTKLFCSGAGLVDRALVAAGSTLVEIELPPNCPSLTIDTSGWVTDAFRHTTTAAITFHSHPVLAVVGTADWYVKRAGFWQGACGPAAAWAGGAAGLADAALAAKRDDPHTLAHIAAMHANIWAMQSILQAAGDEFDCDPTGNSMVRALQVRHLVESLSTDVLRRFARAMGPAPLARDAALSRRYAELDLFLRQSHAERDLEALGRALRAPVAPAPASHTV